MYIQIPEAAVFADQFDIIIIAFSYSRVDRVTSAPGSHLPIPLVDYQVMALQNRVHFLTVVQLAFDENQGIFLSFWKENQGKEGYVAQDFPVALFLSVAAGKRQSKDQQIHSVCQPLK